MFDAISAAAPPRSLQQHPFFAAALRAYEQQVTVLDCPERLQVMQRTLRGGIQVAMLSRAVLNAPDKLASWLRKAGLNNHLIFLSPDQPTPELARIGAIPVLTPGVVAEIDLGQPLEALRAGLHQKWRNRLMCAEKQGLRVIRSDLPINMNHWLLRQETAQRARRGYRGWPAPLTLAYGQENPGMAQLFTAYKGRDTLAAMLFLRHGTGSSYHMGHTTVRGRALSAHNLLLWQAMGCLADNGHYKLDLGLIDTTHAPGLARFKLGSGAKARRLGGTWIWWPPLGRLSRPLAYLDRLSMR